MSGIWSSELASRLPGTPVREGQVISAQPKLTATPSRGSPSKTTSPLWKEMSPHLTELDLLMELKILSEEPVPGVFLLPSTKSLLEWYGILFLHNGPWKGGIFRFTLYIPDEFPQMRPMIRFKTEVYHPYIHSHNRAMNMLQVLPKWKSSGVHIRDVIVAMRECFFREEFWSSSNKEEEAAIKEKIRYCVTQSTKQSQDNGDPDNVFNFTETGEDLISRARHLVHEGELPQGGGNTNGDAPGIMDKLTANFGRFIDIVIGQQ